MNWKQEAMERLSRYELMLRALENIPEELRRLELRSTTLRGIKLDTIRSSTSPHRGEDALINNFVKRQELQKAYQDALIWVSTTDKALSVLEPAEKEVLLHLYIHPVSGALETVCEKLGIEKSSAYRKRDAALCRFTIALYGTQ